MITGQATKNYLTALLPESTGLEAELEEYAKLQNIPIMDPEGMHTVLTMIEMIQPAKILEVGTAIGYSAIRMLRAAPEAKLISIERDAERAASARNNVKKAQLSNRFVLIEGEALEQASRVAVEAPYDVLFIDAAKGQYEKFFHLFEPLVNEGGIILSDNVLFQGFVAGEKEPESRRMKSMARKLDAFNREVVKNPRFTSSLLPVGDGLLVTRKRKSVNV